MVDAHPEQHQSSSRRPPGPSQMQIRPKKGDVSSFPSRVQVSKGYIFTLFQQYPRMDQLLLNPPRSFLDNLKNRPGSHGTGRFTGFVKNRPVQPVFTGPIAWPVF
jgi:hypothetical protein